MDDQTEYVYQEPNYNLNDLPIAADNISTPAARDFVFSEDFLKFQVDTSLSLKNIFYLLQGLEYNEEKQKWLQSYDALLNDDGIHFVMQVMRSFIHKDINLSNLSEKQINDIVFSVAYRSVLQGLIVNWYKFGQPDAYKMRMVRELVEVNILCVLSRAKDGGDQKTIRTVTRVNQNSSNTQVSTPQQSKPGMLGRIFGGN